MVDILESSTSMRFEVGLLEVRLSLSIQLLSSFLFVGCMLVRRRWF